MRIVVWLVVAVLALVGVSARAQRLDVSVRAAPRGRRPTIGDSVTLEFRASLPAGALLVSDTPSVADSVPSGMRVLDAGAMRRSGQNTLVGQVRLAFFQPGSTSTPAFLLTYRRSAGASEDTLRSHPLPIEIASVLPDQNAAPMRDIKGLAPLPGEQRIAWWPVAITLALLLGAAYAVHRTRRRGAVGPSGDVEREIGPPATPYERALRRLTSVEREGWAARGDVARQYDEVTELLRRYLEEAYDIHALDRTTPELLRALPARLVAGGHRTDLAALLDEADLVKFARLRPEPAVANAFLARARALLDAWHAAADQPEAMKVADAAD